MNANYQFHAWGGRQQLADELAIDIASKIETLIETRGQAVVAVSGGSTPKPLFAALANIPLDWTKVVFTLVDERWVPTTNPLSNAAFLDEHLLSKLPSKAKFVPLYRSTDDIEDGIASSVFDYAYQAGEDIYHLIDFDIVVLGMGEDGHTASFFPDAENIAELVSHEPEFPLLTCTSPSTEVLRVTWSVRHLLTAKHLYLHITGPAKRKVFEQAVLSGETTDLPIRAMLRQEKTTVQVYYAD